MPKSVMFVIFLLLATMGVSLLLVTGEASPLASSAAPEEALVEDEEEQEEQEPADGPTEDSPLVGTLARLQDPEGGADRLVAAQDLMQQSIAAELAEAGAPSVVPTPAEGEPSPADAQFELDGKTYCFAPGTQPLWDQAQELMASGVEGTDETALALFFGEVAKRGEALMASAGGE